MPFLFSSKHFLVEAGDEKVWARCRLLTEVKEVPLNRKKPALPLLERKVRVHLVDFGVPKEVHSVPICVFYTCNFENIYDGKVIVRALVFR